MRTRFSCVLLVIISGLAACSLLPTKEWESPLEKPFCLKGFPTNYEVRATLSLQVDHRDEDYFLAIRTVENTIDIALLTLQGIPVYSIRCTASDPHIASQTQLVGGMQARDLLFYLELIFLDVEMLRPQLRPRWSVEEHKNLRVLSRNTAEAGTHNRIQVTYQGDLPWFDAVHLTDSVKGTAIDVKILGSAHVLPE